ncbi:DUF5696 domain-containing protein [Paenibacillus polysaccharolyticus]|uniref:DUF5696 domain-containing protein n=1 Tax=Paenibacillus polysaccharolyticus TaxID=582692 RepID=UPI00203D065C|nr:DUF5696 domain-containing protein [Paenibacillus polysaccharolyticus]MCM3132567.1 DUF5696 domain-containing protein [Paenibacillus polysaccharolyticus]
MKYAAAKKITGILLVSSLLLSGCQFSPSTAARETAADVSQVETPSLPPGEKLKSAFSDTRIPGMIGIARNNALQLLINEETAEIAVIHSKSGQIWRSNPEEREKDGIAAGINKDLLSSQSRLSFFNSSGQSSMVNSFTDSVRHKQVSYETLPNGVRVHYQFGNTERSIEDLPVKISKERFEQYVLAKLDKSGERALKVGYAEDKDEGVYNRIDKAMQGLQLTRALKAFEDAGYTEEDLAKDHAEHGIEQERSGPRLFMLTMEYELDGDQLKVRVPASGIHFPDEYPINTLSVLEYFGAGGSQDDGSILVPDGSGALIHFNNGKLQYPSYQQDIYGPDLTMKLREASSNESKARLPVFGVIRPEGAFLGIIEEGDAAAVVNADISGKLNSYNNVYPSFYVVNKSDITLQSSDMVRTLPKFQNKPTSSDFVVRYAFVGAEQASYSGLASLYREYLVQTGGLPELKTSNEQSAFPFYLKLFGGMTTRQHMLGIPYNSTEALTTFDEGKEILSKLMEKNVSNIQVRYAGWFNDGLHHRLPDSIKVDGVIGGKKGMKEFSAFTSEAGIGFYPDVTILNVQSKKGFSPSSEASRSLTQEPAVLYPMDLALERRTKDVSISYVLSPNEIDDVTTDMLKEMKPLEVKGISLKDMAEQLNSDMNPKKLLDRTQALDTVRKAFEQIKQQTGSIVAEGGNAYALPYVTGLTDAPMSSSRFKLEDEEVPFFQLVVHGSIPYTGSPYNLSTYTDARQYVLKLIEYGASPYFAWFNAPNHVVKETDYNHLYAANYEQWIDLAADIYKEVSQVNQSFTGRPMIAHESLSEGVFRTTYEGGRYVIVNYNDSPVEVDNHTVEALSYLTGGEQL